MGLSRKKSQKMTFEMKHRTDQRREMLGTIAATVFPRDNQKSRLSPNPGEHRKPN